MVNSLFLNSPSWWFYLESLVSLSVSESCLRLLNGITGEQVSFDYTKMGEQHWLRDVIELMGFVWVSCDSHSVPYWL